MNLRIVTAPTAEPLTLLEAMQHMNIELDDRHADEWINRQIRAARLAAEEYLGFPLTDAVYEYRVDRFEPSGVCLPVGKVKEIVSITYLDEDGDEQTLDETVYRFDDNPRAPRVYLALDESWPLTRKQSAAVAIRFQGEFSETDSPPNSPPQDIKSAMGMMIAHWERNREMVVVGQVTATEVPYSAMYLLQPHRLGMGV